MAPTRSTSVLQNKPIPKSSKPMKISKKQDLEFDDRLCRATSNFTNREINILKDHYLNNSKYATKKERMDWAIEFTKNGGDVLQKKKSIMDWFFQRRKRDKQMAAAREHLETGDSLKEMKKKEAVPLLDSSKKKMKETARQTKIRQEVMKKKEAKKKLEAPKRKVIKLDLLTEENEEDLLNHYKNTKTVTLENMKIWSQDLGISIHTVVDWIMNQKPLEDLDEVMEDVMEDPGDAREDPKDDVIVEVEEEEIQELDQEEEDPADDVNPDVVMKDPEDAINDPEDKVNLDDVMEDSEDAMEDPEDDVKPEDVLEDSEDAIEDAEDDGNQDDVMEDPEDAIKDPEEAVIVEMEKEPILEVTEKEQDKENHIPVEIENDDCLLLRNRRDDCFMNTIANLLYSCQGVRSIICNPDLYREGSQLAEILLKLFWKGTNSTKEWRETLQDDFYHSKHQDVGEVFEFLIEDLCKDINLSPMEFKMLTKKKCDSCGHSERSTSIQHFSILKQTRHETFSNLLTEEYAPQSDSKCSCGGNVVEKRKVKPIGSYHFMIVRHEFAKFSNLNSEETFIMFGCSWSIRSFAQYLPAENESIGEKGHFVTWINTGVDWMCVNDNDNRERRKELNLSEMHVNLIVFERSGNV